MNNNALGITKLTEMMDILEWQLDENGLVITDWAMLTDAVRSAFPELEDDVISEPTSEDTDR
jgi:hypothetical protein